MSNDERGNLVVGLSIPDSEDASQLLKAARADGYDFITTSLPSTAHAQDPRADVTQLDSRWWRTSVVGRVPNETRITPQQMEWANHMNLPAVVISPPPDGDASHADRHEHARLVSSLALQASATGGNVWIPVFLTEHSLQHFQSLHRHCDGASNVGMILVLSTLENDIATDQQALAALLILLHKAVGMQLKCVCIPTTVFLTNKRGFPALSKTHQVLLTEVLRRMGRTLRVLVEGPGVHKLPDPQHMGQSLCLPYLQYIRHVRQRPEITTILDSKEASMEEAYLDHLQRPLQPLADQLEFSTYETFERDPVKYDQYEKAIGCALHDGLDQLKPTDKSTLVVIVVVGAGRGPLITATLQAISELPSIPFFVQFQIYAVEKNPSAVVYLQSRAQHDEKWKGSVKIVQSDMRQLSSESFDNRQADIVISELLGSFGDNELSPECLDGFYHTGLWKESTVCIPQKYTAYLAPVSSMRLHSEARSQAYFPTHATDGMDSAPMGNLRAMETPYVVRTHAASQTHPEQACWDFVHPTSMDASQERAVHLEFKQDPRHGAGYGSGYGPVDKDIVGNLVKSVKTGPGAVTIHGFVGTFTAVLYDPLAEPPILISTRPSEFSRDMFSWFPLYFPLREPLHVPGGASVLCSVWRRTDSNATETSGRVWYEWLAVVTTPTGETLAATAIHNPNGRSYTVVL